uniref:Synaptonemal complex protein SC65 n=1 Tax=Ascaris suum TaxID=6253 RepID=F1L401_ASCSU
MGTVHEQCSCKTQVRRRRCFPHFTVVPNISTEPLSIELLSRMLLAQHRLFAICLLLPIALSLPDEPELTFEELYQYGKDQYTAHNWQDCIAFFRRAIEDFDYFVDENVWCREKCARVMNSNAKKDSEVVTEETAELASMYTKAQQALCLFRCKAERFTMLRPPLTDPTVYEEFESRKPYFYLQFCYWKQGDLKSAVGSAFTYLVANPKNKDAIDNMAFYMEQDGFTHSMLVDARQMKYEASYIKGVEAYNSEDWQQCVISLEESMNEFFKEEEKCRRICEDKLDWETIDGVNPEISIILTSVYVSVLRCKNNCAKKLSRVNGHDVGAILPSYFEYLHVCQYKLSRGRDACQSVANSILLNPLNPIMRRNRFFYKKNYEKEDLFQPSEEIMAFHRRDVIERTFLEFVDERFKYENNELPAERAEDHIPLKTDVWMEDDFDYSQLEKPVLEDAECTALAIAAMFETMSVPQRQAIGELQERIAERYRTNPHFESLSCAEDKPSPRCEHHEMIISLDSNRCGAFLTAVDPVGCSIAFCVP